MALGFELGIQPIVPDERRAGERNGDDEEGQGQADPLVDLQPERAQRLFSVPRQDLVAFRPLAAPPRGCNLIANDYQQRNF